MTSIDLLMGLDTDRLDETPAKELRISRLSKLTGADFIVKVEAIPATRFTEYLGGVHAKDGSIDTSKAYKANVKIALAGMVEPSMKDKGLMEKFGCSTPGQLIEKIFKGGEIGAIADAITELSGFSGDVVEEVKN